MTGMDILTQKVKGGVAHHNGTCSGACSTCPYKGSFGKCLHTLLNDANEVIDYWKGKYENTLLDTPPMILNVNQEPSIIKVESSDIKKTLTYAEAFQKLADSGKQASEALKEVTEALKEVTEAVKGLKEVFPDESPNISDIGEWDLVGGVFGESYTFRCTKCGTYVAIPGSGLREINLFDECPNCKTRMCGGIKK